MQQTLYLFVTSVCCVIFATDVLVYKYFVYYVMLSFVSLTVYCQGSLIMQLNVAFDMFSFMCCYYCTTKSDTSRAQHSRTFLKNAA